MQFDQLGPYKIGPRLGRGGMGAVFEGVNVETGEPAAVKVLNPHLADDQGFCERFELEINTLKKLKHPNIVRMFGYGQQNGFLFYAMELVKGHSVEEELQQGRRFTWREVVQHSVKLAKALRHAHDHGVIHRDIKPANLLLPTDDSDIKLTDFGIARLFGNTRLTMDGALVGTAEYMSPEQASGDRVTPQSDLYSLGGVMFAMLAGRPPFRSISLGEMLHKQRFEAPPLLSRYVSDIPPELEELVARLLSKEPAARAPNALVLSRQLASMEHGLSMVRQRPAEDIADEDAEPTQPVAKKTLSDRDRPLDADSPTRSATPPPAAVPYNPNASTMLAPPPEEPAGENVSRESASARTAVGGVAEVAQDVGVAIPVPDSSIVGEPKSPADKHSVTAGAQSAPTPAPRATAPTENRFTTVEEDERRREELLQESTRTSSLVQIVLLTISLSMIAGLGWYLSRPPSAEKLLARIDAAASEGDASTLRNAEDDVNSFLKRFPEHERAADIKQVQDEIAFLKADQQLRASLLKNEALSPVEHDYLDAENLATVEPQRAIDKLQALVNLYGPSAATDKSTAQCVRLAGHELTRLREQSAKFIPGYEVVIDANLARAERLRETSPGEAKTIWQSIITLYGDKPWAAKSVAKAKAALEQTK